MSGVNGLIGHGPGRELVRRWKSSGARGGAEGHEGLWCYTLSLLAPKRGASCAVEVQVHSSSRSLECVAAVGQENWRTLRSPRDLPPPARPERRRALSTVQIDERFIRQNDRGVHLRAGEWISTSGRGETSDAEGSKKQDVGKPGRVGRSRDEGGMSGSDCLRERLHEATCIPLAIWAGGVHESPER